MAQKGTTALKKQYVCTVCGFDYVADFAAWHDKFAELLAGDVLTEHHGK